MKVLYIQSIYNGSCTVLFSFPDEQAIHHLFSDPKYKKLFPIRAKAFSEIRYIILEEVEV